MYKFIAPTLTSVFEIMIFEIFYLAIQTLTFLFVLTNCQANHTINRAIHTMYLSQIRTFLRRISKCSMVKLFYK